MRYFQKVLWPQFDNYNNMIKKNNTSEIFSAQFLKIDLYSITWEPNIMWDIPHKMVKKSIFTYIPPNSMTFAGQFKFIHDFGVRSWGRNV